MFLKSSRAWICEAGPWPSGATKEQGNQTRIQPKVRPDNRLGSARAVNGERSKGHFGNLNLLSFSSAFPPSHETHDQKKQTGGRDVPASALTKRKKKSTVTIAPLVPSDGQIPSSFPTPSFLLFFLIQLLRTHRERRRDSTISMPFVENT